MPIEPVYVDPKWTWTIPTTGNIEIATVGVPGPPGPEGPAGPAGSSNHSLLSSLDFASSGHTGFVGTDISNTFVAGPQVISSAVIGVQWQFGLSASDRSVRFRASATNYAELYGVNTGSNTGIGLRVVNGGFTLSEFRLRGTGVDVTAGTLGCDVLNATGLVTATGGITSPRTGAGLGTERFGDGAGPSVTGLGNSLVGYQAGSTLTTGTHNTLVGFQAGGGITTGNNNVFVGSQLSAPTATDSSVVIGRSITLNGGAFRNVALGIAVTVSHADGVAIGTFAATTKNNQMVLGRFVDCLTFTGVSSTEDRPVVEIQKEWADSTDATRAGRMILGAYSTSTFQAGITVEANAAGVRHGFYGGGAVAKQTLPAALGGGATLADVITAFNALRTALINSTLFS
jgi:hypothetical protein